MRRIKGFYQFLNVVIKEFNEVMLQKAETIRCQRQISLLNEEFNQMIKKPKLYISS